MGMLLLQHFLSNILHYLNDVGKKNHTYSLQQYDKFYFFYSQTPDHPKLYLWSEQGSTRNEEPIQDKLEECKFIKYYFYV